MTTTEDTPFSFISPKLVGGENFVITNETIPKLMGKSRMVSFNLCFVKVRNKLPQFGVSTVPAKALLSLSTRRQCKVSELGVVKMHEWMSRDTVYWNERNVDNNYPVVITFRLDASNPKAIELIFSHNTICSLSYSYCPDKLGCDVYFVIFAPKWEVDEGRIMLLSNFDYFTRISEGVKACEKKATLEQKSVTNECISCYSQLAEIVFIPCGHSPFCKKCVQGYGSAACAICKQTVVSKVTARRAAKFCLICPVIYNCQEVNAMLLPCCCVVGCIETTRHSIRPGEECMNCDKIVSEVQQIYS